MVDRLYFTNAGYREESARERIGLLCGMLVFSMIKLFSDDMISIG